MRVVTTSESYYLYMTAVMYLSDCSCVPILQFFDAALDGTTANRQIPAAFLVNFLPV